MAGTRHTRLELGLVAFTRLPEHEPRIEFQGIGTSPPLFELVAGSRERPLTPRWRASVGLSVATYLSSLGALTFILFPPAVGALPGVMESVAAFVVTAPYPPSAPVNVALELVAEDEATFDDQQETTSPASSMGDIVDGGALGGRSIGFTLDGPVLTSLQGQGASAVLRRPAGSTRSSQPAAPAPIRVGGAVPRPKLVRRVDPSYPPFAEMASIRGIVVLEAVVDEAGRPSRVTVLKSCGELLDAAARHAVQQWRYEPLLLAGAPHPFALVVTVSFRLG